MNVMRAFLQLSLRKCPWWIMHFISSRRVLSTMIRSFFSRIPSQKVISLRWVGGYIADVNLGMRCYFGHSWDV